MSWESVPECEAEQSTAAPIFQDAQSRHSWQIAEKRKIRKLLREFGKSSAVKRVAEEHLLTGKCFRIIKSYQFTLLCVCMQSVGSTYTKTLKSFTSHVFSRSDPDLRKVVNSVLNNEGIIIELNVPD